MSLRFRLFLLLAALAVVLAGGQWWLVRAFSADLAEELPKTAAKVGHSVVQVMAFKADASAEPLLPVSPQELTGPAATVVTPELSHQVRHEVRVRQVIEGEEPQIEVFTHLPAEGSESPAVWLEPGGENVLLVRGKGFTKRLEIPTSGVEEAVDRFSQRLLFATLGLLAVGLLGAMAVAHRVTAPLGHLAQAAERVAAGELGVAVPGRVGGEVGRALDAFNRMSGRLVELDADARALRAREHLSELGEVGRGLAHSLRNPLNALGLAVDELAAGATADPRGTTLAARARRQIRRIDSALRSFLALGNDGPRAAVGTVDLAAVARDVALELLQARPEGKDGVRVEVEAGAPAVVRGVEAELRAAVQALVVNAVEASPDGAVVTLQVEPREEGAEVRVSDRGPGLPPEVREKLFTPHLTTKPAGAGFGLYLAHRVATSRYGGTVALEDRPGGGTRAVLTVGQRTEAASG